MGVTLTMMTPSGKELSMDLKHFFYLSISYKRLKTSLLELIVLLLKMSEMPKTSTLKKVTSLAGSETPWMLLLTRMGSPMKRMQLMKTSWVVVFRLISSRKKIDM